ncbi:histone H1A-like [Bombina bombina]|uniref:histone H1A-like n=1 Tax=Bombina bombina TaxID=8345 RepID=UPI00235AF739|nr:histone H1A-like [Bombina bombina]
MAKTTTVAASAKSAAPAKKQSKKKSAVSGGAKKSCPTKLSPSIFKQIFKAVSAEHRGVSMAAVKKALIAKGYNVEKNNGRIQMAIRCFVSKEHIVQLKGRGASGSFKVNKKQLQSQEKADKKKALPPVKAKSKKVAKPKGKADKKPSVPKKSTKKPKEPASAKVAPLKSQK